MCSPGHAVCTFTILSNQVALFLILNAISSPTLLAFLLRLRQGDASDRDKNIGENLNRFSRKHIRLSEDVYSLLGISKRLLKADMYYRDQKFCEHLCKRSRLIGDTTAFTP